MARAAQAAWAGAHLTADGIQTYVARLEGSETAVPAEHAGAALDAASARLPKITRAEALQRMARQ